MFTYSPREPKILKNRTRKTRVYYIESGEAMFTADGRDQAVKPGSIVFVAAGVDHRFHSIRQALKVLVFFSAAKPA